MGLLQDIESMVESGVAQRLAGGQGNFESPASPDAKGFQQMLSQAGPDRSAEGFAQAARQMDPGQYSTHVTPGAGGTNPLGGLGAGGLSAIASTLMQHLTGAGGNAGSLLGQVPGLRTTDPAQMDAQQVASLSSYTQQNHPDIFGRVAAQLGQQSPDLLHSFVGKAGLAIGAAALASHFIKTS